MKILYAEDEDSLRDAVKTILTISNHEVTAVANGRLAVEESRKHLFDVIVMDVMMPELDGFSALKQMRAAQVYTPVLILTAKAQTDDKVLGLSCGADDYLAKPFEASELIARIEGLNRRNTSYKSPDITFSDITVDTSEEKIMSNDKSLTICKTEIDIFRLLARINEPIKVDELADKTNEDKDTLKFYAQCLQRKIELLHSNVELEIKDDALQLIEKTK